MLSEIVVLNSHVYCPCITAVKMGMTARFGDSDSERDSTMRTLWAKNALTLLQALDSPESQVIPRWRLLFHPSKVVKRERGDSVDRQPASF